MKRVQYAKDIIKRISMILVGVLIAVLLARSGILHQFLTLTEGSGLVASFVVGIFLSSSLTIAIAAVAIPIPDEFGLTLLGIAKVKTSYVLILAFLTTFIEILIIISIARVLLLS